MKISRACSALFCLEEADIRTIVSSSSNHQVNSLSSVFPGLRSMERVCSLVLTELLASYIRVRMVKIDVTLPAVAAVVDEIFKSGYSEVRPINNDEALFETFANNGLIVVLLEQLKQLVISEQGTFKSWHTILDGWRRCDTTERRLCLRQTGKISRRYRSVVQVSKCLECLLHDCQALTKNNLRKSADLIPPRAAHNELIEAVRSNSIPSVELVIKDMNNSKVPLLQAIIDAQTGSVTVPIAVGALRNVKMLKNFLHLVDKECLEDRPAETLSLPELSKFIRKKRHVDDSYSLLVAARSGSWAVRFLSLTGRGVHWNILSALFSGSETMEGATRKECHISHHISSWHGFEYFRTVSQWLGGGVESRHRRKIVFCYELIKNCGYDVVSAIEDNILGIHLSHPHNIGEVSILELAAEYEFWDPVVLYLSLGKLPKLLDAEELGRHSVQIGEKTNFVTKSGLAHGCEEGQGSGPTDHVTYTGSFLFLHRAALRGTTEVIGKRIVDYVASVLLINNICRVSSWSACQQIPSMS
jgi:hypothetical protein